MIGNQEQSAQTGTRNETYDVIAVLYHALQGAENCQRYVQDARNEQARAFFEQALQAQRQLADRGKQVLEQVLQESERSGGSAFGWQQQSGESQGGKLGESSGQAPGSEFERASPNLGGQGERTGF